MAWVFLTPVALQEVDGYSPLTAGTALLAVTTIMLALSARAGSLTARIEPRLQTSTGLCMSQPVCCYSSASPPPATTSPR